MCNYTPRLFLPYTNTREQVLGCLMVSEGVLTLSGVHRCGRVCGLRLCICFFYYYYFNLLF